MAHINATQIKNTMATKEKEAPKKEVAKQESADVSTAKKALSPQETVDALNEMEEGEKDSGYFQMEPGEQRRVVYMGMSEIQAIGKDKGVMTPAVKLATDSGKQQINADKGIVSYFERQLVGCARKIVCTGKKVSDKGEYKTFDFYELKTKA